MLIKELIILFSSNIRVLPMLVSESLGARLDTNPNTRFNIEDPSELPLGKTRINFQVTTVLNGVTYSHLLAGSLTGQRMSVPHNRNTLYKLEVMHRDTDGKCHWNTSVIDSVAIHRILESQLGSLEPPNSPRSVINTRLVSLQFRVIEDRQPHQLSLVCEFRSPDDEDL